ncbi:hypothetical protein L226DRAFT_576625 [Lentinus tigrinus ALCF2SS1-7]|uniref:uncharacterized protein n=1 Tax=Lentinus tigrinus ALCF2SS1-7 TaxID=1328758 RepID=UPI00116624A9|nr:hypothetical protein L226DRAFT_576625 [Lentinus tigrinus ALCF2SS1-7]
MLVLARRCMGTSTTNTVLCLILGGGAPRLPFTTLSVYLNAMHKARHNSICMRRIYEPDTALDDYQFPPPSQASASSPSRTERLVLTVTEQMPALRYLLVEIPHDSRPPPYEFTFDALRRYERRFWRIDGSEEFLCLDLLSEAAAWTLMDAEGLTFEDRVRYW